jgi:hypothetical protein
LFDPAVKLPLGHQNRRRQRTAQRRDRNVVVQLNPAIAPIALVLLVAYGEIENTAPPFDGVAQKIVQMRDAGPEAGQLSVIEVAST